MVEHEHGRGTAFVPWAIALLSVGLAVGALWRRPAEPDWTSYAEVYAEVAPVVVNVSVQEPEPRVGSGFAVAPDQVVTARHLVADASTVTVRTVAGREVGARVVGTDARTDLALLQVQRAAFEPAVLGTTEHLAVGDTVLAIGNPYGLGHSLAIGVLGSRDRRLAPGEGPQVAFLQLTIPLNPGNSGGPIFDERGEVVGVLTGTHAQGQAIAFAVPVETVREILPVLAEGVHVSNAFLGLRTRPSPEGLVVVAVLPSGPAGRAGVRAGDVLVKVAGEEVRTGAELRAVLDRLPVTSHVFVQLLRDGVPTPVDVRLEDRAEHPMVVSGMTLAAEGGTGGRVLAVRPRSRADAAGIAEGDLVLSVRGMPVRAPADVEDLLADGGPAQLEILRDGALVAIQLE